MVHSITAQGILHPLMYQLPGIQLPQIHVMVLVVEDSKCGNLVGYEWTVVITAVFFYVLVKKPVENVYRINVLKNIK